MKTAPKNTLQKYWSSTNPMLANTRGIVFHTIKYSDSTLIAKVYTEEFGLRSYLVNAAHSKRSGTKGRLLQPLALIEMSVYEKERQQLLRVKEIKSEVPFLHIPDDPAKRSIVLFLNEVLFRCIREEEKNPLLFGFIHSSLQLLDLDPSGCANFHLTFLAQLTRYLGFFPKGNYSEFCPYFDLRSGVFHSERPNHADYLQRPLSEYFFTLMNADFTNAGEIKLSHQERKDLLAYMLLYYRTHMEQFGELSSHKVLEEVMSA
jgi:DNA repair protein RecO (recombination protein O)